MNRSTTARVESSEISQKNDHKSTFVKTKIKRAIEFCESMSISYFKKNVFQFFEVNKNTEWNALNQNTSRRHHNDSEISKTRDRRTMISSRDICEMNRLLQTKDIEERNLTWEQLEWKMSMKCSDRTIQRAMRSMKYHKCVVCRKSWVSEILIKKRKTWAEDMLAAHLNKKNWYQVRFNDEVHFEYDSQDKIRIIRKLDERYCQDCIQKCSAPDEKDVKRQHCWTAVEHEFKSNIYFYEVSENTNDKMS